MKKDYKNYIIFTYGCEMNLHESEKIAGVLESLDYKPTDSAGEADIIAFNTCCIREDSEQCITKHIEAAGKLKSYNSQLKIIVCGCMTQQEGKAEEIKKKFPAVDYIIGTHNIDDLANMLQDDTKSRININTIPTAPVEEVEMTRTSMPNAWVNIIYGCNNFCTYCIVPYVRGRERSRSMQSIIDEVKSLVAEGYKEITLLGQNVNSYGNDLKDGSNFAKLLNELAQIPGDFRLRFTSSHPKDFTDDVIDVIASSDKICKHIHLPVQSGANSILKAMNRKYTREQYLELVKKIKTKIPSACITTDIIVGFNGETEEDFNDTLALVRECKFTDAFCFAYSKRKGTAGYEMSGDIPEEIKNERLSRLIDVQSELSLSESSKYVGKIFRILVEDFSEELNVYYGRTDFGKTVYFSSNKNVINQFIDVKITDVNEFVFLIGEAV